jgi:hypothetical protein
VSEGGQVAGRLLVEVEATVAGFARDLRQKIDEAAAGVKAKVGLDVDETGFREKLRAAVDAAAAGVAAKVRLDIDKDHLRATLANALDDASGRAVATVAPHVDGDRIMRELRQVLAEAAVDPNSNLRIPADIDQGALLATVRRRLDDAERDLTRGGGGLNIPFKFPTRPAMMASLLSLVQPVVGALGQWVTGATGLVGAVAPAVDTLGALPGVVTGVMTAFLGSKVLFSGVGQAVKSYAQQQAALTNGTKLTKAQQLQLNTSLKGVSTSAKATIGAVFGLSNAWKSVKLDSQERFFSQISKDITPLGKSLLPLVHTQLNGIADTLGKTADRGAKWMQTGVFRKDFKTIASTNSKFIGSMSKALGSLGHAGEDWLVATAPFTQRMGRALDSGAKWVQVQVAAGRESGKLNRVLNSGAGSADQFGRSIAFLSKGLYGFFTAPRGTNQSVFNGFEMTMAKFDKWANSPVGKNKIAAFFKEAEPGFHEFNALIGSTVKGLAHMAGDNSIAGFVRQIRTQFGPALSAFLNGLGHALSGGTITLISNLAQILGSLAQGAAGLAPLLGVVNGLAQGLDLLLKDVPGLSTALGGLLIALLALKAGRAIGGFFQQQTAAIGRFRQAVADSTTATQNAARQQGLAQRQATSAQLVADQQSIRSQALATRARQANLTALQENQRAARAELAATGAAEGSGLRTAAAAARARAQASTDVARAARQEATQARATAEASGVAARQMQADYARSVRGMSDATAATNRWGAAVTQLGTRYPGLAAGITRLQTSFRNADGSATSFGTRMSGVARAAGTGLRGALGSLTSFLGGPWGVALIGAGIALNLFASRQRKAAQAAQEHEERVSNLTQALVESKGVIDDNVRAQALQELQTKKVSGTTDNLVVAMRKSGIGAKELIDAYTGQGDSLSVLENKLKAVVAAHTEWDQDPITLQDTKIGIDDTGKAAANALKALGALKGDFKDAAASAKDYADGVGGSAASLSTYDKLRAAAENVADANQDAEQRVSALRKALDLLGGGTADLESANASLQETIQQITDGMADQRKQADALGSKLLDKTTGGFNQATKSGLALYQQFTQLATEGQAVAQIAYDNAKGHMSLSDAVKTAEQAMQPAYATAQRLGKQYGFNSDQIQGLAEKYGLIPSEVVTVLKADGLDETTAGLLMVKTRLDAFPTAKTIKVDSLTKDAQKSLTKLGLAAKYIPATKQFEITVKDKAARARLDAWFIAQDQVRDKAVTLSVADLVGRKQLDAFQKKVNASKGKAVVMGALTAGAEKTLDALGFKVTHMKNGTVRISLPTSNVADAVSRVRGYLDGIDGKVASVYIKEHFDAAKGRDSVLSGSYNADGAIRRFAGGRMVKAFADGGLAISRAVRAFADGAENHIAQIGRPGDIRVWNEPETKGEAYIPLAPEKRGRSEQILGKVAQMFGGRVVYNANGSITTADLYRASRIAGATRPPVAAGQSPLVGGDLIIQRGDQESTSDALGDAMFELKRIRAGGAYAGG